MNTDAPPALIFVCSLLISNSARCQTTFGEVLGKYREDRVKMTRYMVDIQASGNFDYTGQAKNSQALTKDDQIETYQHIEYSLADQHTILVQRFKGARQDGSWKVVGESKGVTYYHDADSRRLKVGESFLLPTDGEEYPCRTIDPRLIGFQARADLMKRVSLESMTSKLLGALNASIPAVRKGDLIYCDTGSLSHTFDPNRGFAPVEMRFSSSGIYWKTDYEKFDNVWLPVSSTLQVYSRSGNSPKKTCGKSN